jgi:hypothetical protein
MHLVKFFMSRGVGLVALGELRIALDWTVMFDHGSFIGDQSVAMRCDRVAEFFEVVSVLFDHFQQTPVLASHVVDLLLPSLKVKAPALEIAKPMFVVELQFRSGRRCHDWFLLHSLSNDLPREVVPMR